MKKRSALLAVTITCLALLIFALHTTPAAANKFNILQASTATLIPTLPPDIFTMDGAVTLNATNGLFSINLPKGWPIPCKDNSYTFLVANQSLPQVALETELLDS